MKNRFLLIIFTTIFICSNSLKNNIFIANNKQTQKINNSLKDLNEKNNNTKLQITNTTTNIPKNVHINYQLKFDMYRNNGEIININTNDLNVKNATYLITNQLCLNKSNNYTFEINVNHMVWHKITINRDNMVKPNVNTSNIKITEYLFNFNWVFNLKNETFRLNIAKEFKYKYSYVNQNGTEFYANSNGDVVSDLQKYTFPYNLPPNPISPSIDNNFDGMEIVVIILLGILFLVLITISFLMTRNANRSLERNNINNISPRVDETTFRELNEGEQILHDPVSNTEDNPISLSTQGNINHESISDNFISEL